MGGRAGGTGSKFGSRSGRGTMRGYSSNLASAVSNAESSIRDNEKENAFIFDSEGNVVYKSADVGATEFSSNKKVNELQKKLEALQRNRSVSIPPEHVANNIVTHNHPNNDSFSSGDLIAALNNNASEIRAVGRTYTFSLKRKSNGWPNTSSVVNAYNNALKKNPKGPTKQHEAMKAVAKQFGLDYTWQNKK